ncbi:hypothetical protein RQP46_006255 [Phenoliferia psychrophenolica]
MPLHLVQHGRLIDQETRRAAYLAQLPPVYQPTEMELVSEYLQGVFAEFSVGPPTAAALTPAPPRTRPFPRLPDEVLTQIVYAIDTVYFDPRQGAWAERNGEPWRELRACALTSKAFLWAARERLYRSITISLKSDLADSAEKFLTSVDLSTIPERLLFTTNSIRLEQTLVLSPHLAEIVKEVVIYYPHRAHEVRILELGPAVLTNVLQACSKVTEVEILSLEESRDLDWYESDAILAPLKTHHSLRRLRLDVLDFQQSPSGQPNLAASLITLRHHESTLKELDIRNTYWDDEFWSSLLPINLHLETLTFSLYGGSVPLFNFLTAASSESLRKLELDMGISAPGLDLARFTNLESLTWTTHSIAEEPNSEGRAQIVAATSSLPLKHLTLDIGFNRGDFQALLTRLPQSLQSLTLSAYNPPEDLIIFLASQGWPLLESITIEIDSMPPFTNLVGALDACRSRGLLVYEDGVLVWASASSGGQRGGKRPRVTYP